MRIPVNVTADSAVRDRFAARYVLGPQVHQLPPLKPVFQGGRTL